MGFKDLKKQSRTGGFDKLSDELNKLAKKGSDSYKDDRFWRPELDKSSNGYAVIRFLPPVDGEDIPWVRVFNHGFQGPGGWMIENGTRAALRPHDTRLARHPDRLLPKLSRLCDSPAVAGRAKRVLL